MKIGFRIPQRAGADRALLLDFAQTLEGQGFDSIWTVEHFMWPVASDGTSATTPPIHVNVKSTLQPLEVLSFVAAVTTRVDLATSILVTAYHTPLQLATRLATLDVLSEGRVVCGMGLGYVRAEYDHVGTPWSRRGPRMDEFISSLRAAWGPDPVTLDGEFYRTEPAYVGPKPYDQNRSIPLVLGGGLASGPFDRVATLGDGWFPGVDVGVTPSEVMAHHARLVRRAEELGRIAPELPLYLRVMIDPTNAEDRSLPKSYWSSDPGRLAEQVADARAVGVDHLVIDLNHAVGLSPAEVLCWVERLAPVLEAPK